MRDIEPSRHAQANEHLPSQKSHSPRMLVDNAKGKVAMRRNTTRLLVTLAAMASALVIASPASAATTFVGLSVDESTSAPSLGTIVSSSIPGCSSGTVNTA